jgi:hypothetical protein
MRVVDSLPIGGRSSGRPAGCRTRACGCALVCLLLALLARAALGWILRPQPFETAPYDPVAAERFLDKVDVLGRFYDPTTVLRDERLPTTVLTEKEINSAAAFALQRAQGPLADALERFSIELEEGLMLARGHLELSELAGPSFAALPWPVQFETGIEVRLRLTQVDGKGRVVLESIRLGTVEIGGETVLYWAVRLAPELQPQIELLEAFPLPFGTRDLRVGKSGVVVEGS